MGNYIIHNGIFYDANELMHYGVKGMKWGVRKEQENRSQRRPAMVDYSPEVVKKFNRTGPKSGPTDSAIGRVAVDNTKSEYAVQGRINKAVLSNISAAIKLNKDYKTAALHDYPACFRYATKLPLSDFDRRGITLKKLEERKTGLSVGAAYDFISSWNGVRYEPDN